MAPPSIRCFSGYFLVSSSRSAGQASRESVGRGSRSSDCICEAGLVLRRLPGRWREVGAQAAQIVGETAASR